MTYNEELYERCNELEAAQEILTKKYERLERALRALVGIYDSGSNIATNPFVSVHESRSILDETFPI